MESADITRRLTSPARSRAGAETEQTGRSVDTRLLLVALLIVSLLLRVLIAAFIARGTGFKVDIGDFTAWALDLAERGPGGFYRPGYFADYPPAYLYVLWAMGLIGGAVGTLIGDPGFVAELVKVPAVLADAGVGWLLFIIGRRFFTERVGLVSAAIYLLNPGVIFDSSVWGQVDSVGALVLLATLYVLARGWTEAASALAVVATLVKFQYAFVIPIVLVVGLRRHLIGRSSDDRLAVRRDPLRVLTSLAVSLVTLIVVSAPFGLALYAAGDPVHSLWHRFLDAASTYTGLSINGFNLWMNPISDLAASGLWGDDTVPVFAIGPLVVTWQLVGLLLFLAVAALALRVLWKRDDPPALLFVALLLAVAFFVLPTRVHERYLFPALAFAAPFAVLSWRWRAIYGVLATSFFFNIYYAYTIPYFENPGVTRDPLLGATILSPPGIYLLSFSAVVVLGVLVFYSLAPGRLPLPGAARSQQWDRRQTGRRSAPAPAAHRPVGAALVGGGRRGSLAWLRSEPRDPLYREQAPRFGSREAALFGLIVLVALVFRVWRLDTPKSMHFDEVYHARSGMEWLANWQYGANRDVYEWTHPMLAKYLIAAGMVLADPNRVLATADLREPATELLVVPPRSSAGRDRSFLFAVEGGTQLVVRDGQTYAEVDRWTLDEPAAALAFDEAASRLLVGSAESGRVTPYAVSALLTDVTPRAPPERMAALDTELRDALQLEILPGAGPQVVVRGSDGVAVIDLGSADVVATSDLVAGGIGHVGDAGEGVPAVVAIDMATHALRFLDPATLEVANVTREEDACPGAYREASSGSRRCERRDVLLPREPIGPLAVVNTGEGDQIFVPLGESPGENSGAGAMSVVSADGQSPEATVNLPGMPRDIRWNAVTNVVYVAGPQELWAVEPHGDDRAGYAVFDTTALPGEPVSLALDASAYDPDDDNERLLVSTAASAALVVVDAGSNAFGWRIAGAVFGALLAGLAFLLGAVLFRNRRVGVLAGAFVAFDALSFAQSRIAMNDVFVAVFIVAAYLLFWQVWSGRWARSAWWALPLVGVFIGLASATKWVGFYALAGLLVLVLARSDLGRVVLLAGLTFLLVVAGIGAPWPFAVVLAAAVILLAAIIWARPLRIAFGDLFALPASGAVVSLVMLLFLVAAGELNRDEPVGIVVQVLARGAEAVWPAAVLLGLAAVLLAWRAFLSLRRPESDQRWYLPGEMAGFAWPWAGASLVVVPLVVYTLTYLPYLQMGHGFATPGGPGFGWSLEELQVQMFSYHFGLQAGHPAMSPWWSWPAVVKPVWFYQGTFDESSIAVIYNGGNLILFWAGVPAIIFCAIQAWRRQSLALLLITVAFAFQWLPWTRIERASFLYHYFTALPFFALAVAYAADEALRGQLSRRLAIGGGVAALLVGLLLYPIASALPMPDWYIHAFQALPPWNFYFQFPEPPQGDRALITTGLLHLFLALVAALLAALFALFGRDILSRRPQAPAGPERPLPESS